MVKRYIAQNEPKGRVYRSLVTAASGICAEAYMIVTPSLGQDEALVQCLRALEAHKVREERVSEWPGTSLGEGWATRLYYRTSDMLATILNRCSNSFGDWLQPSRPEDLGFLRQDGTLWLGSVAHNNDVFFDLSLAELTQLQQRIPELVLLPDLSQ